MPIYEYECQKCSLRFELRRRFGEDGTGLCPQCGGQARRLFSPVPIIFKGPGFYVTDSRKNHNRPSDEGSTSKDKKPESE
ncbi:MAG TPA: zinc ribbon domain-containing protein [Dehalococcoidia bacterium]|nr:zinc ribbon domain-containing protein [Dehalococcoidia bacterium]